MKRSVALLLLGLAVSGALAAQSGRIPIMTWPGPDAALLNAETLRLVAEAGFSVNMSFLGGREANLQALALARAAGLKVMVQDDRISKLLEDPALGLDGLDGVVADYGRHPALFGYFVTDEPNAAKFRRLGAIVARLRSLDPVHPAYINLFPTYANATQLGTPTYEEHVTRFLNAVLPPFLSFDHYPVTTAGLRPDYYRNLELMRVLARERGLDLWAFTLVTPHAVYPPPTAGQVRLQLWSDIAYGAKALQYFTFATPGGTDFEWGSGLIDKNGRPGPAYAVAREINAEIRRVEGMILRWKSVAVYHTGPLPAGARAPDPGGPVLSADGLPLLVGVFADGLERCVVLVNKDYERPGSAVVRFAPDVAEAREAAVRDRPSARLAWPSGTGDRVCRLEFEPGEARIFRLK